MRFLLAFIFTIYSTTVIAVDFNDFDRNKAMCLDNKDELACIYSLVGLHNAGKLTEKLDLTNKACSKVNKAFCTYMENFKEDITRYGNACNQSQDNVSDACWTTASAYFSLGNFEIAEPMLKSICEKNKGGGACIDLGLINKDRGKREQARMHFSKYCKRNESLACYELAKMDMEEGKNAKESFKKICDKNSSEENQLLRACHYLGILEYKDGNIFEAEKRLHQACILYPDSCKYLLSIKEERLLSGLKRKINK
jgi:tetratricopeptide (TPR) repeat protein